MADKSKKMLGEYSIIWILYPTEKIANNLHISRFSHASLYYHHSFKHPEKLCCNFWVKKYIGKHKESLIPKMRLKWVLNNY